MDINFKPNKKQYYAWQLLNDNETREIGYGGSAGGGKSWLGCFFLLALCLRYPDTAWVIGRRELTNLKKTTLMTFFKVVNEYGLEDYFKLDNQQNVIKFNNRSRIYLMDLSYQPSDPLYTRLGGLELTGAFVDESNEVEEQGINILKTRIGRGRNKEYNITPKLLETFNPTKNHVFQRYYKPWKDNGLPKHRAFIQALPTDNEYLSEEYIQQLRNADRITRERLLKGNFEYEDDPNALLSFAAINDIFANQVNNENEDRYITADIARFGNDKSVVMVWQGWVIEKIFTYKKKSVEQMVNNIRTLSHDEVVPFCNIVIDENGIGAGVNDMLRGTKGFMSSSIALESPNAPVKEVFKKGKVVSITEKDNFKNLKAQCAFYLADKIMNRQIRVKDVDEETKERIISELEQLKTKDAEKIEKKIQLIPKDEMKAALAGSSPDYMDAMIMRIYFEFDINSSVYEFINNQHEQFRQNEQHYNAREFQ